MRIETEEMELSQCSDCGWVGDSDEVEMGCDPMVFLDPVTVCPACRAADSVYRLGNENG
jgi:Zn ribbon nucleic-acid-binding protein